MMPQKLWSLPLQVPFLFGEVCHGRLRYVDGWWGYLKALLIYFKNRVVADLFCKRLRSLRECDLVQAPRGR